MTIKLVPDVNIVTNNCTAHICLRSRPVDPDVVRVCVCPSVTIDNVENDEDRMTG